jgi:hypothetical protein
MWPNQPEAGMDMGGNVHIPFMYPASDIPFARWQMVSEKIFHADKPIVVQSLIVASDGSVWIQYAFEVNDQKEQPREGPVMEMDIKSAYPPDVVKAMVDTWPNGMPLVCDKGHPMKEEGGHYKEADALKHME